MSIGSWTPDSEVSRMTIDRDWLQRCIALSQEDNLDRLSEALTQEEQQQYAPLMRLDQSDWMQVLEGFSEEELLALIRFFTLAEMQLTGWEAGNQSPVIWINRHLRERGSKLSRDMLVWIKANSDNRFIPNGGL